MKNSILFLILANSYGAFGHGSLPFGPFRTPSLLNPVTPLANPLFLNPAYTGGSAGITSALTNNVDFRRLHGSNAIFFSTDIPSEKLKGGLGILMTAQRSDDFFLRRTAALSYGHAIKINEQLSLRAGATIGYFNHFIDLDRLTFLDPVPNIQKREGIDISGGLLLSHKKYSIGTSISHINKPDISMNKEFESPLPMDYSMHGAYTFTTGKTKISPHLLFMTQGEAQTYNMGVYVDRNLWYFGVTYVHSNNTYNADAIFHLLGIRFKGFNLGYSYSITVSNLDIINHIRTPEFFIRKSFASKKERKQPIAHNPLY